MDRLKSKRKRPELIIQEAIITMLLRKDWFVKHITGNAYNKGWPDLYCSHSKYGIRWVEVKNPKAFSFTTAQLDQFPKMVANGSPIWILVAGTEEEYAKLFKPCNWYVYLSL